LPGALATAIVPGPAGRLVPRRLRQVIAEGRVPPGNRVRYHAMEQLGYFPTESSEHFAEYVPCT
jgi:alpha-galactosidase